LKIRPLKYLLNIEPGGIPGYFGFGVIPALFQAQEYCGILLKIRLFVEKIKAGTERKIMRELTIPTLTD
jgi:hypothetical protein